MVLGFVSGMIMDLSIDKLGDRYTTLFLATSIFQKYRTSHLQLAGGTATKATLAMIGEGSEPEAIIPLSKLSQSLEESYERERHWHIILAAIHLK